MNTFKIVLPSSWQTTGNISSPSQRLQRDEFGEDAGHAADFGSLDGQHLASGKVAWAVMPNLSIADGNLSTYRRRPRSFVGLSLDTMSVFVLQTVFAPA
jgi:hypothetical protein